MKCASMRTSALEKFSSSAHFGISAWSCVANLIASPRRSRCASCGGVCVGRSDIGRDIMPNPRLVEGAPAPHRPGEHLEKLHRRFPAKAGIGDALSEYERLARLELLAPLDQMRLEHQPHGAGLCL